MLKIEEIDRWLDFNYTDTGSLFCIGAALLYIIKFRSLEKFEKPIAIAIWVNMVFDITCFVLSKSEEKTGLAYNILLPAERILALYIYGRVSEGDLPSSLFKVGIIGIILIRLFAAIFGSSILDFQFFANTIEGLLTAILSYIFIRLTLTGQSTYSHILFAFGIANFFYLMLMSSAMSAVKVAQTLQIENSLPYYGVNTTAYILWSLILITGLLWKKQRI